MSKHRILIVEDHPLVRIGLKELCASEPDLKVCGEAESVQEALEKTAELEPDLIILDLALKDSSGLDLIQQLSAAEESPKILVSSMHDEVLFAERSLRAGAWGYIEKQAPPETFLEAARTVLNNKIYLSSRMSQRIFQRSFRKQEDWGVAPQDSLSDRELQVFELIGEGHSVREISEMLNLSGKTIETYREHIKDKLGLKTSLEVVRRAVLWLTDDVVGRSAKSRTGS